MRKDLPTGACRWASSVVFHFRIIVRIIIVGVGALDLRRCQRHTGFLRLWLFARLADFTENRIIHQLCRDFGILLLRSGGEMLVSLISCSNQTLSTVALNRALACAVAKRINASNERGVTGKTFLAACF